MAKLFTSTDDNLYVSALVSMANEYTDRTIVQRGGTITLIKWNDKFEGKQYCEEGCINGRCLGHFIAVHIAHITRHPDWKYAVYHSEQYSNGTTRSVFYFYEEDVSAYKQASTLRKRASEK
jgi:hypothetical protein